MGRMHGLEAWSDVDSEEEPTSVRSLQENLSLVHRAVPGRSRGGPPEQLCLPRGRRCGKSGALKGVVFFPSYQYLSEMRRDKIIHALCPKSGKWML